MIATTTPSKRLDIQHDKSNGWKAVALVRQRPDRLRPFLSVDEYLAEVREQLDRGEPVPVPTTVDELRALLRTYPDIGKRYLPSKAELRRLNISTNAGRTVDPFPVEFRERLIATVGADADFRAALARMLGGGL